ncbi:MAG: phosphoribosyl-ATP diphosphatase [Geobacteraceae bacterium]
MNTDNSDILQAIYQVIRERKASPSAQSYTASLMTDGIDRILKKLGEEATGLVIAGKSGSYREVVSESADLLYHLLVLLGYYDINPDEVYVELRNRFGVSGIAEKESRGLRGTG